MSPMMHLAETAKIPVHDETEFRRCPAADDSNRSMRDSAPLGLPEPSLFECRVQLRTDENDHD
jgi:hypothetical protein